MTHDTDHDFQQFRGRFDSAMTPDAAFKAKMEKLLNAEVQQQVTERTSSVIASPPAAGPATVVPSRRSQPLMVAAAVLIVFAVVASSAWVLSGSVLEDQYANAPGGIATLPADAPGTPGPDVELAAERVPGIETVNGYLGFHGGLLLIRIPVEDSEANKTVNSSDQNPSGEPNMNSDVLAAIDPRTLTIVWEQPYYGLTTIGASGNVLLGIEWDYTQPSSIGGATTVLVALDLQTGEKLWSHPAEPMEYSMTVAGGLIVDDVVVVSAPDHALIGRDVTTGEVVWETTYDPGEGWLQQVGSGDSEVVTERWYAVAGVAWKNYLVIVNGDGLVQLIDAATGTLTTGQTITWPDSDIDGPRFTQLYAIESGVVLYMPLPSSDGLKSLLSAFDPTTGTTHWSMETDGQQFIDVADNDMVALQSITWNEPNWLQRLFGDNGTSIFGLSWVDGRTSELVLSTESGEIKDAFVGVRTDGNYMCALTAESEISCYDRTGTRYVLGLRPLYQFELEDGVLYVPTSDGVFVAKLP